MKLYEAKQILEQYKESNDSTFTHNSNTYSVNDLFNLSKNYKVQDFNVDDLKWIFKYSKPEPNRQNKPDLKHPVIISDYGNKLVVIDGLHRLDFAIKTGIKSIKGIFISSKDIEKNLKTVDKNTFYVYHYFSKNADVKSIIKNGLKSISELPQNNAEWAKYYNRDGKTLSPREYFETMYNKYARDALNKPYFASGIYTTPHDLFTFENKMFGRVKLNLYDYYKNIDVSFDYGNPWIKIKSESDIQKIKKINQHIQKNIEHLYRLPGKTYLFENLIQITFWAKTIKIKESDVEYR